MSYAVKEIFYTLQGEGLHAGRPAVLLRFSGCNLWSGLEEDRENAACRFCDTDFVGGQRTTLEELAKAVERVWLEDVERDDLQARFVVVAGGEPMLQFDEPLMLALDALNFRIAIETNGTVHIPAGIFSSCWITVSPKAGAVFKQRCGDELKLVYPQRDLMPGNPELDDIEFDHWFLQPMDGEHLKENTDAAIDHVFADPRWRLSLQVHKTLGLP